MTTINIPQGKKVSYVPDNFSYDDGVFKIDIKYSFSEDFLVYEFELRNQGLIQPASYRETWYNLGKKLRKQYRKTVELTNK